MHAVRQMRGHCFDNRLLDRAHVRDRRTGFENSSDICRNVAHDANRHTENDKVCAFNRFACTVANAITQPDLARCLPRFGRTGISSDFSRYTTAFHRPVH